MSFWVFQPIIVQLDGIQGIYSCQSFRPTLRILVVVSIKWVLVFRYLLLLVSYSIRYTWLLFTSSSSVLPLLSFWWFWSCFYCYPYMFSQSFQLSSLISLFSMAEGGCEKFPDHWDPEFFWTVIVEYISHRLPTDILIKRWVSNKHFFLILPFPLVFQSYTITPFCFIFSGSFYLTNLASQIWNWNF